MFFFSFARAKVALLIFFLTASACIFQDRNSSRFSPTNLKEFSLQSMPIRSIFSLSMNKFKSEKSMVLDLSLNIIYLVLETLRVSLFALNQSANLHSSILASLNRDCGSDPDIWSVVSSAKRIVKKLEALGRSFIRIRNSIGPKMLP